ncbi:hypothetical protein [Leeuwenhoekiella sp. LLG6367-2.1]|uniref:hypothetical protein n=1 Tax=Leeuwenhoekiella sp. LLG6367-2.1 TaxID=3160833 RepID=UPI0038690A18
MVYYRFANYSRAAIEDILKRIGKVRFEKYIENSGQQRPKKLANFRLLYDGKMCSVEYKFPQNQEYSRLFLIKEYEMPEAGWVWEMYKK